MGRHPVSKRAKPGQTAKEEFQYTRHGTVCVTANWHVVEGQILTPTISETRDNQDFAHHIASEKDSQSKGDGKITATFRFEVPKSGRYQVLMAYSAHESRATNVPVMVSSGADKNTFLVDQTKPLPSGKHFRPVATVVLQADVGTVIQITNADTTGFVILDALQLLPVESKPDTKE